MNEKSVLTNEFAHYGLSPAAKERVDKLRLEYSRLHRLIVELTPRGSREQSLAVTNLETSAMWAIKDVCRNDPDSTVEKI